MEYPVDVALLDENRPNSSTKQQKNCGVQVQAKKDQKGILPRKRGNTTSFSNLKTQLSPQEKTHLSFRFFAKQCRHCVDRLPTCLTSPAAKKPTTYPSTANGPSTQAPVATNADDATGRSQTMMELSPGPDPAVPTKRKSSTGGSGQEGGEDLFPDTTNGIGIDIGRSTLTPTSTTPGRFYGSPVGCLGLVFLGRLYRFRLPRRPRHHKYMVSYWLCGEHPGQPNRPSLKRTPWGDLLEDNV